MEKLCDCSDTYWRIRNHCDSCHFPSNNKCINKDKKAKSNLIVTSTKRAWRTAKRDFPLNDDAETMTMYGLILYTAFGFFKWNSLWKHEPVKWRHSNDGAQNLKKKPGGLKRYPVPNPKLNPLPYFSMGHLEHVTQLRNWCQLVWFAAVTCLLWPVASELCAICWLDSNKMIRSV